MKFKVDGNVIDFDETSLTNREVMDIEARCGVTLGEFSDLLTKNSMLASTALVWIALRRSDPSVRFDDVVFPAGDFIVPETVADPPTSEATASDTESPELPTV